MKKILLLLIVSLIPVTLYSQRVPDPERIPNYDLVSISIHVIPDWESKSIAGKVTTALVPLKNEFNKIDVDAVSFDIKKIYLNTVKNPGTELKYSYNEKELKIDLDKKYTTSDTIYYTVEYSCQPQKGLYFIYPTELDPEYPYQLWTQGQAEDNKYWLPVYDYPNNKAVTEMIADLPAGMTSVSNGYLVSTQTLPDGLVRHHWNMDEPHSTYLIMLAAGDYHVIEDSFNGIPVESYVTKDKIETGEYTFRNTPEMLKLFIEKFGEYPWVNYKQVVVKDFIYGGMENTTATVLNERVYYTPEIENDYSGDGLISHELGHMWWGDNTTCRNWSEIWLNESFATYSSAIWTEHVHGKDEYDYEILRSGDNAIRVDSTTGRYPIWAGYGTVTTNTYGKGSAVLNSFRHILGDKVFFDVLKNFQTQFALSNVTTPDLIEVVNNTVNESRTGDQPLFDYSWMFDQWIYKAGHPEVNVFFNINETKDFLNVVVKQVQREDSLTPVFRMPVVIFIKYKDGEDLQTVTISQREDKFSFPLRGEPEYIIFDKGNKFIKTLYTNIPVEMLLKQIIFAEDAIDRLTAVRQLEKYLFFTHHSEEAAASLKSKRKDFFYFYDKVFELETFHAVRSELADLISNYEPETALSYLEKIYAIETNSKTKRRILKAVAKTGDSRVADFIFSKLENESNIYIVADGLDAIVDCTDKSVLMPYLEKFIGVESHRGLIANAVIKGLGKIASDKAKEHLLGYAFGISIPERIRVTAVGELIKFAAGDEKVKELTAKYLDWNFRPMKQALINLLGTSGDISIRKVLENLKEKTTDESVLTTINTALEKLK